MNASSRFVSGELTETGLTLCSVTTTLTISSTTNVVVALALKLPLPPTE